MSKTFYIVQYNDRYGNGQNKTFETLVKSKDDFNKWLSKHNKYRVANGDIEEGAEEFDLIPITLFEK